MAEAKFVPEPGDCYRDKNGDLLTVVHEPREPDKVYVFWHAINQIQTAYVNWFGQNGGSLKRLPRKFARFLPDKPTPDSGEKIFYAGHVYLSAHGKDAVLFRCVEPIAGAADSRWRVRLLAKRLTTDNGAKFWNLSPKFSWGRNSILVRTSPFQTIAPKIKHDFESNPYLRRGCGPACACCGATKQQAKRLSCDPSRLDGLSVQMYLEALADGAHARAPIGDTGAPNPQAPSVAEIEPLWQRSPGVGIWSVR